MRSLGSKKGGRWANWDRNRNERKVTKGESIWDTGRELSASEWAWGENELVRGVAGEGVRVQGQSAN